MRDIRSGAPPKDAVREWQNGVSDRMYPIKYFDALRGISTMPTAGMVKNKAVHIALESTRDGVREVLGLWIAEDEGAKFWLAR